MKIILLCAGKSRRTNLGYPKCLYKFDDGEMLIEKNLKILRNCGFKIIKFILQPGLSLNLLKIKN